MRDHEDDEIILHHYYLIAEISPANLPDFDIEMIIEFAETAKGYFLSISFDDIESLSLPSDITDYVGANAHDHILK